MSANVRLTIRQPPHRDFIDNYVGLTGLTPNFENGQIDATNGEDDGVASRSSMEARLIGTVEVRVSSSPVQAKWLRIELKKTETVSTSKGLKRYFELIGSQEHTLWQAEGNASIDSEGFAPLDTTDCPFSIPVPTGLPPSVVIDRAKNTGIVYHLVATLLVRPRNKSFFGSAAFKAPAPITQTSEVFIEKHELNSAWPIYEYQAEFERLCTTQSKLTIQLKRKTVVLGSGDPMTFTVEIKSDRNAPVKITKLELTLREIIISRESGPNSKEQEVSGPRKLIQQVSDIVMIRSSVQKLLYHNEITSHSLSAVFPTTHYRYTVQNAKHIEVKYFLRLRAFIEIPKEAKLRRSEGNRATEEPVKELLLDDIPVLVSPWSKKHGEWWKAKIGQIPPSLQRPDAPPKSLRYPPKLPPLVELQNLKLQQPFETGESSARTSSDGHVSAESLATGRRLSSFPRNGSSLAPGGVVIGTSPAQPRQDHPTSMPVSGSWPDNENDNYDTASSSQPQPNGDTPLMKEYGQVVLPIPMNGAYPIMNKSTSQSQNQSPERLKMTAFQNGSQKYEDEPTPRIPSPSSSMGSSSQDHWMPNTNETHTRRLSVPAISSLPMSIARRRDATQPVTAFHADRPKASSEVSHAEYFRRQGTLSTITGSPPESPAPSPGLDSFNSVVQAPFDNGHRNSGGRAGTLPSLSRSVSNPSPARTRSQDYTSLDTVMTEVESSDAKVVWSDHLVETPRGTHLNDINFDSLALSADPENVQLSGSALDANSSPTSGSRKQSETQIPSTQGGVDEQKLRYLKALAAREAYQQKLTGSPPVPLTALEEKQLLQRSFDADQLQWKLDGHRPTSNGEMPNSSSPLSLSLQNFRHSPPAPSIYSTTNSVYLTPAATTISFFESPHSSSSHLPLDASRSTGSMHEDTSVTLRDPSIVKGKQRRFSFHSHLEPYAEMSRDRSPPERPPKSTELVTGAYDYLDSPIE